MVPQMVAWCPRSVQAHEPALGVPTVQRSCAPAARCRIKPTASHTRSEPCRVVGVMWAVETCRMSRGTGRRGAAAVLVALMVLTALTGCGYWRPFNDAAVGRTQDGVVVVQFGGAGTGYLGRMFTTTDGVTWRMLPAAPVASPDAVPGLHLQTEACVPGEPDHCYRVAVGHARVQESSDGGLHWSTVWELTAGRSLYLRRGGGYAADSTGAALRLESTSVVVLPLAAGYTVIVADQNDGLVVRRPDGRWARVGLATEPGDPTVAVPDTELGQGIVKEYLLAVSTAGLALLLGIAGVRLAHQVGRARRAVLRAEGIRILLGLGWTVGLDLVGGFYGEPGTGTVAVLSLVTCCVLAALVLVRRAWPANRRETAALLGAASGTGLLTLLPFLGWTVGYPDSYLRACALALTLAGCGLAGSWLLGFRRHATAEPHRSSLVPADEQAG